MLPWAAQLRWLLWRGLRAALFAPVEKAIIFTLPSPVSPETLWIGGEAGRRCISPPLSVYAVSDSAVVVLVPVLSTLQCQLIDPRFVTTMPAVVQKCHETTYAFSDSNQSDCGKKPRHSSSLFDAMTEASYFQPTTSLHEAYVLIQPNGCANSVGRR